MEPTADEVAAAVDLALFSSKVEKLDWCIRL